MYDAPTGFEGTMLTAQLTDVDEQNVQIGMPVEMVTCRIRSDGDERGTLVYGYKFRPLFGRVYSLFLLVVKNTPFHGGVFLF